MYIIYIMYIIPRRESSEKRWLFNLSMFVL